MSTAAPPSQPVSNGTTSHTSPPPPTSQQQQPPSPSSSTPRAINAAGGGGGFGQNAVAGPSRNANPSFPVGSFSNIGQPNGVAQSLANGQMAQTQDPTALQARLIQAQQAMQANMQQQNQMPGPGPGPGAQDTSGGGAGVAGGGGGGPTAKMASAIGMLQGQPGSAVSKEAMMRQLQALSQSRQQQERASTSQASPPNPTTANLQSLSNPPPNPVAPLQQNGAIPNGTPTPNPQPQAPPLHHNIGPQRRQFCQSLLSYHKHTNQPVPPELFAGERPGTLAMGDHTVELVDLFMAIMRQAPGRAGMLQNGEPHKVFYDYVDRNFPNPLPAPVKCPKPVGSSLPIPDETTDPVRFLFMAYVTYLQGFETHMMRQRSAMAQQQKQPQQQQQQQQQGGPPVNAPTPTNMASTPITAPSPAGTYTGAPSPHPSLPAHIAPSPVEHTPSPPASAKPKGKRGPKPKLPPAIQADVAATAVGSPATPTTVSGKKRKKGMDESGSGGSRPQTPTTALPPPMPISNIPPAPPPRLSTPKRARYKVEYRPLHHPITHLCGWDERAVSSTFPKHNLAQPARSVHEIGIVDMEAVLMGLRSRLKREMGYGLTVLNMLSMPHPEENIGGLPLLHLREIYDELLELLEELVLGNKGLGSLGDDRMTYLELEQLGRDIDWPNHPPESNTDTILSIVNLLRNFTMMPDNFSIMAGPELFHLIAAISHSSLLGNPYSVLDLGRIRRDCVSILANLAPFLDLRRLEFWAVKGIFQLLASFLNTAWESLGGKESWWTLYNSAPPPTIHSINRALEAWCKLAQADSNREVLARLPSEELVELYTNLVKLLPVSARQFDALRSIEDTLGLTECLALSIYSLVFLSPSSTRTLMRAVPGTVPVFLRIIEMTASAVPPSQSASLTDSVDFRTNPFAVLCRRIAETLGILNGTASCMADIGSGTVSFGSASAGEGWSYANQQVEPGWLAGKEDLVLGVVARNGLDPFVRMELDGMWWTGGEGSGMM